MQRTGRYISLMPSSLESDESTYSWSPRYRLMRDSSAEYGRSSTQPRVKGSRR